MLPLTLGILLSYSLGLDQVWGAVGCPLSILSIRPIDLAYLAFVGLENRQLHLHRQAAGEATREETPFDTAKNPLFSLISAEKAVRSVLSLRKSGGGNGGGVW